MSANESMGTETERSARDRAAAAAREIGRQATSATETAKGAVRDIAGSAADQAQSVKDQASGFADQMRDQASQGLEGARGFVSNIASEARNKVAEIVDQQKNAGAAQLSGFSRAAQSAAGELEDQNPQVAQLVRDAASTVDGFAGDLRSSDIGDIVASVSRFARKQPVAFFAASVLAGLVLARFVKSEPVPAATEREPRRQIRRA